MSDSSRMVSDLACLGSIFAAERQVYGTGWTAVRDRIAREPKDDKEHWAEQTVVLYPSEGRAKSHFADATSRWKDCGGYSVSVDDGQNGYVWEVDDIAVDDDLITQVVTQQDSGGWDCQHALTVVSNVTVETWGCAYGVRDEAVDMARQIVAKAAKVARR